MAIIACFVAVCSIKGYPSAQANAVTIHNSIEILRNDKADRADWTKAAVALTSPTGRLGGNPKSALKGEELRASHGREIVTLFAKRVKQLTTLPSTPANTDLVSFEYGLQIAHCLAVWDTKEALGPLQGACERSQKLVDSSNVDGAQARRSLQYPLFVALSDRFALRDASVVKTYVSLRDWVGFSIEDPLVTLRPLWLAPKDEKVQSVGKYAFRKSLERMRTEGPWPYLDVLDRALLDEPRLLCSLAFREFLTCAIGDSSKAGQVRIQPSNGDSHGFVFARLTGGEGYRLQRSDVSLSALRQEANFSAGDYVCQLLSEFKKSPPFALAWPDEQKTAARKGFILWLQNPKVDWYAVSAGPNLSSSLGR